MKTLQKWLQGCGKNVTSCPLLSLLNMTGYFFKRLDCNHCCTDLLGVTTTALSIMEINISPQGLTEFLKASRFFQRVIHFHGQNYIIFVQDQKLGQIVQDFKCVYNTSEEIQHLLNVSLPAMYQSTL